MKNANIFIDVDLILVDANGRILPGAIEGLAKLRDAGCHLFMWSSCGAEYCRKVADTHRLTEFFEGFSAKPDIVIDDMPGTCIAPFTYDVGKEGSWEALSELIVKKHID